MEPLKPAVHLGGLYFRKQQQWLTRALLRRGQLDTGDERLLWGRGDDRRARDMGLRPRLPPGGEQLDVDLRIQPDSGNGVRHAVDHPCRRGTDQL